MVLLEPSTDGSSYEDRHVHQVYDQIAPHFSSTRYKAWPLVEQFLINLPRGSVGLDVGCGNGKYLSVNPEIFIIASDRSINLSRIASRHPPHVAIVADNLSLPHPRNLFDFAISIAVIHHFSTRERRIEAIAAVLGVLRTSPSGAASHLNSLSVGGKCLIYVWALEQKNSRRGWSESDEQDVMVPWVMKEKTDTKDIEEKTFFRYYHLYRQGELEHDVAAAGGVIIDSGYERDNWWVIAARPPPT